VAGKVSLEEVSGSARSVSKLLCFGIPASPCKLDTLVQGDIEAVAGKQPQDLTKLFESISGSDAYKADYEKFQGEMDEAHQRFLFAQTKKKTTAAEKRQKKEQKVEAEKHIKKQEQLVIHTPPPPLPSPFLAIERQTKVLRVEA